MIPALVPVLRGTAIRRIVAAQVFTFLGAVELVLLAIAYDRPDFCDLGIALGLLSFAATMAYARFFERWL